MTETWSLRPLLAVLGLFISIAALAESPELTTGSDGCQGKEVSGPGAFGGPYAIGGKKGPLAKEVLAKVAEFVAFHSAGWNYSEVACLEKRLFKSSYDANRASGFPFSDQYQRYNYVVMVGAGRQDPAKSVATIHVARWRDPDGKHQGGLELWSTQSLCRGPGVASDPRYEPYRSKAPLAAMVNFFPEETDVAGYPGGFPATFTSPCHVTLDGGGTTSDFQLGLLLGDLAKKRGVLDAHGKHFMLRQAPKTVLMDFVPPNRKPIALNDALSHQWAKNGTVAFAGEIVVDVEQCTYSINQGSGTYRPDPGPGQKNLKYLHAAAEVFQAVLGSPPSTVVYVKPGAEPKIEVVNADGGRSVLCPDRHFPDDALGTWGSLGDLIGRKLKCGTAHGGDCP